MINNVTPALSQAMTSNGTTQSPLMQQLMQRILGQGGVPGAPTPKYPDLMQGAPGTVNPINAGDSAGTAMMGTGNGLPMSFLGAFGGGTGWSLPQGPKVGMGNSDYTFKPWNPQPGGATTQPVPLPPGMKMPTGPIIPPTPGGNGGVTGGYDPGPIYGYDTGPWHNGNGPMTYGYDPGQGGGYADWMRNEKKMNTDNGLTSELMKRTDEPY